MTGEYKLKCTVSQTKLVAGAQDLKLQMTRFFGNLLNCSRVCLTGYRFAGTAGAVPDYVVLACPSSDAVSHFLSHTFVGGRLDLREVYVPLYPPGGIAAESRTHTAIMQRSDGGYVSMEDQKLLIQSWDATVNQFANWNDWTTCILEFELTCRLKEPNVMVNTN